MLSDMGTSSRLHVRGSFCPNKVLSSNGLAETQQYWVFYCQVNVKYKQLLCKGAPIMPVTPNLAFTEDDVWLREGACDQTDRGRPPAEAGGLCCALPPEQPAEY